MPDTAASVKWKNHFKTAGRRAVAVHDRAKNKKYISRLITYWEQFHFVIVLVKLYNEYTSHLLIKVGQKTSNLNPEDGTVTRSSSFNRQRQFTMWKNITLWNLEKLNSEDLVPDEFQKIDW
jgi:hypothetical protein